MSDQAALDDAQYRAAVERPARLVEPDVDGPGQSRLSSGHIHDGELERRVVDPAILAALQIGNALAVRTPLRTRFPARIEIRARKGRELPLGRARASLHHVEIEVEIAIGILAPLGDVREELAIG